MLKRLEPQLLEVIYVSEATRPMSDADLVSLLRHARSRNQRLNVTGMLLYEDGRFIEVLEGEEANVRRVFGEIQDDARQTNLETERFEQIPFRHFPDWTMGFRRPDDAPVALGFTRFLEQAALPDYFDAESVEAHSRLLAFKRNAKPAP